MTFPFAANEIPGAGKLGEGPTAYTPVLTAASTNPNLGDAGVASGYWVRTGRNLITGRAFLQFGGSGIAFGSGIYRVSLPFPADLGVELASGTMGSGSPVGPGMFRASVAGASSRIVVAQLNSATTVIFFQPDSRAAVTEAPDSGVWDRFSFRFAYVIE